MTAPELANSHASSTGQVFTGATWLDTHFEASRPQYEAQVRAVGIRPGWRVLDAGCGSGAYLPWLAELVGSSGSLMALDLAPDNIASVEQRVVQWSLPCQVETRVGSIVVLPYPDSTFDAVWCANTVQYLTDTETDSALAEFLRVVRPGGLVALKENDQSLVRLLPAEPGVTLRRTLARERHLGNATTLRACALPALLRRAGLIDVRRVTTLIEFGAPLSPAAYKTWHDALLVWAGQAASLDLSEDDHAFWATLRDPVAVDRLLTDRDFYGCEGNTLAVGRVPE